MRFFSEEEIRALFVKVHHLELDQFWAEWLDKQTIYAVDKMLNVVN